MLLRFLIFPVPREKQDDDDDDGPQRWGTMLRFSWLNPGQIVQELKTFGPLQPAVVGIPSIRQPVKRPSGAVCSVDRHPTVCDNIQEEFRRNTAGPYLSGTEKPAPGLERRTGRPSVGPSGVTVT